ncbi:MAG: hypothetical protein V7K42_21745 [Nostoc sp.]
MELSQDSSWQLLTVQDYRNQKASIPKPSANTPAKIDDFSLEKSPNKSEISTIGGLSYKEMNALTPYSLSTIRSKASKGESIATTDGFIYRYDKDPKGSKWVRV